MHVAVKRDDYDLKQLIDLDTRGIAIPSGLRKHGSSLQILLRFDPPSPDPIVIATHPHLVETATF